MKRLKIVMLFLVCVMFGATSLLFGQQNEPKVPLFEGIGAQHYPISTRSPEAQRYFDQGLILSYGFNHKEAERSFREAARLDPECAMAYWGIALVQGPNINAAMEVEAVPAAYEAVKKALTLATKASEKEQAYIFALSKRYAPQPVQDRKPLDIAYADAMRELAKHYPDDPDAFALFAEALMDLHPWDYWEKHGQPKPWTPEILNTLESGLQRWPNHPGLNHFYIHAVESSPNPERGIPGADRLRDLLYPTGVWHFARGMAYIGTNQLDQAENELNKLKDIAADTTLRQVTIWDINSTFDLLQIATEILTGETAAKRGQYDKAIAHLQNAVRFEDNLTYDEPPSWFFPVRHNLGAVLLEAGRAAEAEKAYREDLTKYPENGWSLYGMHLSLAQQGKKEEAEAVKRRFEQVWSRADIILASSRF